MSFKPKTPPKMPHNDIFSKIKIFGLKMLFWKIKEKSPFWTFLEDFRSFSGKKIIWISISELKDVSIWDLKQKNHCLAVIWWQSLKGPIFCLVKCNSRVLEIGNYEPLLTIKTHSNFCAAFSRLCKCILTKKLGQVISICRISDSIFEKIGASLVESEWLQSYG